ncbi:hypothetical protein HPB50_006438 [Hyalomma asiaticum]|nr:hypothetical protein HPB50_006438 [Hyalomma asiaticum]
MANENGTLVPLCTEGNPIAQPLLLANGKHLALATCRVPPMWTKASSAIAAMNAATLPDHAARAARRLGLLARREMARAAGDLTVAGGSGSRRAR